MAINPDGNFLKLIGYGFFIGITFLGASMAAFAAQIPGTSPYSSTNELVQMETATPDYFKSGVAPNTADRIEVTPTPPAYYMPIVNRQPTPTPSATLTPTNTPKLPNPPSRVLYCNSNPRNIPDNDLSGISSTITINDSRTIWDLDVRINADHTWVGDLMFTLTHQETSSQVKLIDRPGYPATSYGCSDNNIITILDDEITSSVENKCAVTPAAISGIYIPEEPLSIFDNQSLSGSWRLNISDHSRYDIGYLKGWCLAATVSEDSFQPTPTPPVGNLPSQAIITGVTGKVQSMPLDCESRSAVDWAAYFGVKIDEFQFFNRLPRSNNPDKGFVGDPYGTWGQIPPADYGVHAEPVAALLRKYGLEAYSHRPLSWDSLRAEISAGRPVFVWIIGSVINGIPVYYTDSDGQFTIVAPYEHTVIITGYTENSVSFLNGATIYTRSLNQFLDSWSVLGNMAITTQP